MKKILGFGCIVIVIILISIGYIAWRIFSGAGKQKDLGISVTAQQAQQAQEKSKITIITLPDSTLLSESIRYEGKQDVSYSMDSTELTALALSHSGYKYFPFSNIQIRINPDGSVEVSCVADTMKAFSYATAIGFAAADLEKAMNEYKIPRSTIPVYVKGTGSVTNGKVTLNFDSGSVAGIPVPMGLVNNKKPQIIGIIEDGMRRTPGYEARSITFKDGVMSFDGSSAEKQYIVQ